MMRKTFIEMGLNLA
jgi:hypothetical protein